MSGDTSSCGVHLDGALRFMAQARGWKAKFSPKAKSLHRIYFYLRCIYESTALHPVGNDQCYRSAAISEGLEDPELILTHGDASNDAALNSLDRHLQPSTLELGHYESIYGVPQSLLALLSRATDLIRQVISIRDAEGTDSPLPVELSRRCDELEKAIMDWSIGADWGGGINRDSDASSTIIYQTTHAFHNALIIYFAQHVRMLSYRYLSSYVQNILESIESVEKMKVESRILAAPLYWPAFIAASEAFNDNHQRRFKGWYEQTEVYGIAAMRTGISVLLEVWKRGPVTKLDKTSRWRMVVDETNSHLMLS